MTTPPRKMHVDELDIDVQLIRRLLAVQLSQWADLPLRPVRSSGSDNAMFRLGDDMVVRLPRRVGRTVESLEKEFEWLPRLAPQLPLAVPVPLALGAPAEGYPCAWAVYGWLPGAAATADDIVDVRQAVEDLAGFLAALRSIDTTGAPSFGEHNFFRGVPLERRDENVRAAIAALSGELDAKAVTRAWEAALEAPDWGGPPRWIHGDLSDGNLLARRGRFSGVVDWGGIAAADPACDLMVAWSFLPRRERELFRAALEVDDATWERARGWALSVALIALPYYQTTNPVRVAVSWRRVGEVLADHASGQT
jgi:aminoglycoside phosphotransferase (APT) family kinase protein